LTALNECRLGYYHSCTLEALTLTIIVWEKLHNIYSFKFYFGVPCGNKTAYRYRKT